jgi:Domain of unknown function (DUF4410)
MAAGLFDGGGGTSLMGNWQILSPWSVIAQARDTSIFQIASHPCLRSVEVEAMSLMKFFSLVPRFCKDFPTRLLIGVKTASATALGARPVPTMKLAFLFPATVCLALCSCASVSVREVIPLAEPPVSRPQTIFVQTFEFEDDMVRVGRQGAELEGFRYTMQQEMTSNLLERIRKYIAPAQAVSSAAEAPQGNSWLISGRFTRVNQGSRFLRGALGFGSGGTKMDVTATVSDLSGKTPKRFLMIQTSGGSNAMPGAIVGVLSWPASITGAHGLVSGLSSDCRRTSRELTSALAQYMKKHGLQVADDTPKPKPRGSLPWLPRRRDDG